MGAPRAAIAVFALPLAVSLCACFGSSQSKAYEPPDERFVLFNSGSADPNAGEGFFSLGYVMALLDANPGFHVLVVGHADAKGSVDANRDICFKRARAVRKVLMDHGVDPKRLMVAAPREQAGPSEPALSRRADVYVYDPVQDEASKRLGYEIDLHSE